MQGGYLMQGLAILGYCTACDFRDSNKNIFIADTEKVISSFNGIEVRQAGSRVDMNAISITALGTTARGDWVTTDNADINLDGCTFTDMGTFGFLGNSTILNSVFRRTDKITTGGATFTGCTFDSNRATTAVLAASPAQAALISDSTFTSDGTGYGIEITGTAANMALTNVDFSGYASSDGTSGNEAVFINIAGDSMNLTISGGTIPSIRTAGCVVTVISGAVSATLTATTASGTVIENARVLVKAATGGPFPFDTAVTISNSGTTATVTHTGHGMATNDKVFISGASLDANLGVFSITKIDANSYSYTMGSSPGSNPTGAKCTFVILAGLTNASGQITMNRVFASNQPFAGWARKGSATPFYKTAQVTGIVSSTAGASFGAVLILDE